MISIVACAIIMLTASASVSFASPMPSPSPEPSKAPLIEKLIEDDKEITKKIEKIAKDADLALAGEKSVNTANLTHVSIRNQFNWSEGGNFSYLPNLDIRLHMPNLERKWQLKFTSYDEDKETRGINRDRIKTAPIPDKYGGAVGLFQKLGEVNAEFQPRIEYQNGVQVSYILKLTSSGKAADFAIQPEAQFFARSDDGVGEFFGFNVPVHLYKTLVLTAINQEQYIDQDDVFSANNGITLEYAYNDLMIQSYTFMLESSSRPTYYLSRYTVGTVFTHKIYKNVLHYAVNPYLAFPRELNFRGSPGINFEFKIIF